MSENGQTSKEKRVTKERMSRDDVYYKALQTRDPRFDGKFFVGVKTTGIYCRPVCPAKPKRENVEFFSSAHEAERGGYRPCLRCRPESAPKSPAWIGKSATVQRAIKLLDQLNDYDEEKFAARFGVSSRHLRRLFVDEIGKTPKQIYFESRLNLARKLMTETSLSLSEIAFASGFKSIRRFNDAFKDRFKRNPSELRRAKPQTKGLVLRLAYRPPFDYRGLLFFYRAHQIGDLEWFEGDRMHRIIAFGKMAGEISIENKPDDNEIELIVDYPDTTKLPTIISRVRAMFDLDSDPLIIANALEADPSIKKILKRHQGIRIPSGWDPFEVAIATVLGQLVSVERGRALVGDLIRNLGREVQVGERKVHLFPAPQDILKSSLSFLKTTGVRKQTLHELCRALTDETLALDPEQDVEEFTEKLLSLKGIGPWTASYMALKVLRHTDAFPGTDLILARALEIHPPEVLEKISPWRGYAASLFWREYSDKLTKKRGT